MRGRRHFIKQLGGAAVGIGAGRWLASARPPLPSPEDPDFWKIIRLQYPLTHERVYLNTGGLGPAPYPVLDAVARTTQELQTISETGHDLLEASRAPVAAFFGAKPSEIAFMRNATEGNATVASGLALQAGDEVIFESHAHPGGAFPWMNRQKHDGIRVKLFEPDPSSAAGNLERIEALLTPRTRVIQVSHVTAPTGLRFPVAEIAALAHARDCWFHIDGAQSAGMIPVDLPATGCDSYATSGHKWMGGPHGTGVLFVREERLDAIWPTETGAYANGEDTQFPEQYTYYPTARRFEPGTRDAATVVGLAAAVAFLDEIGMERIAARGQFLARYLQDRLRALPGVTILTPTDPALSASMTTFKHSEVPSDRLIQYFAATHALRCRIVHEQGLDAVRVSTHLFNSEHDCDRVVEAARRAPDEA